MVNVRNDGDKTRIEFEDADQARKFPRTGQRFGRFWYSPNHTLMEVVSDLSGVLGFTVLPPHDPPSEQPLEQYA